MSQDLYIAPCDQHRKQHQAGEQEMRCKGASWVNWPPEAKGLACEGPGTGATSWREPGLQSEPSPPRGRSQSSYCISEQEIETRVLTKKLRYFKNS